MTPSTTRASAAPVLGRSTRSLAGIGRGAVHTRHSKREGGRAREGDERARESSSPPADRASRQTPHRSARRAARATGRRGQARHLCKRMHGVRAGEDARRLRARNARPWRSCASRGGDALSDLHVGASRDFRNRFSIKNSENF